MSAGALLEVVLLVVVCNAMIIWAAISSGAHGTPWMLGQEFRVFDRLVVCAEPNIEAAHSGRQRHVGIKRGVDIDRFVDQGPVALSSNMCDCAAV